MAKALVIKGADFSANKVETITISNPVPCTGISLSETAIVSPSFGSTIQLTATVTPIDTTDQIVWSSSNASATVSSTGLVTINGVGNVTITATCGAVSATCVISNIIHTVNISSLDFINTYSLTSTDLSFDPPKDFVGTWSDSRGRLFYDSSNPLNGYVAPVLSTLSNIYPLALPNNTSNISVSFTGAEQHASIVFVDANELYTFPNPGTYRNDACRAVSDILNYTSQSSFSEDVPQGANGFVLNAKIASGGDISTAVIGGTITFT